MVSPRCAVPVVFAIAILFATLLARIANRRLTVLSLTFLCVWVLARESACGIVLIHQRHAFFQLRDSVERTAAPGEPVAVGDSLVLMPLYWYGSPNLRRQLLFPVDFDAIHRTESDDSGEQNLWGGRNGVFPVPIAAPTPLLSTRQERVLIAPPQGWLARNLRARSYELTEVPASVAWDRLGGVSTPLTHPETRILLAAPSP
jgi:hypothetical protein